MSRKLRIAFAAILLASAAGCGGSTVRPTNEFCIHAPGPFLYMDKDTEETKQWGDRYNATWEALCQ